MGYRRGPHSHPLQTLGSGRPLKVHHGNALSSDYTVARHLYPTTHDFLCNIIAIAQLIQAMNLPNHSQCLQPMLTAPIPKFTVNTKGPCDSIYSFPSLINHAAT